VLFVLVVVVPANQITDFIVAVVVADWVGKTTFR